MKRLTNNEIDARALEAYDKGYQAGRKQLLDQIEKEVEFVSVDLVDEYDDYGKGWHDACLEYDLKLMKLDKKLSALRKEENDRR